MLVSDYKSIITTWKNRSIRRICLSVLWLSLLISSIIFSIIFIKDNDLEPGKVIKRIFERQQVFTQKLDNAATKMFKMALSNEMNTKMIGQIENAIGSLKIELKMDHFDNRTRMETNAENLAFPTGYLDFLQVEMSHYCHVVFDEFDEIFKFEEPMKKAARDSNTITQYFENPYNKMRQIWKVKEDEMIREPRERLFGSMSELLNDLGDIFKDLGVSFRKHFDGIVGRIEKKVPEVYARLVHLNNIVIISSGSVLFLNVLILSIYISSSLFSPPRWLNLVFTLGYGIIAISSVSILVSMIVLWAQSYDDCVIHASTSTFDFNYGIRYKGEYSTGRALLNRCENSESVLSFFYKDYDSVSLIGLYQKYEEIVKKELKEILLLDPTIKSTIEEVEKNVQKVINLEVKMKEYWREDCLTQNSLPTLRIMLDGFAKFTVPMIEFPKVARVVDENLKRFDESMRVVVNKAFSEITPLIGHDFRTMNADIHSYDVRCVDLFENLKGDEQGICEAENDFYTKNLVLDLFLIFIQLVLLLVSHVLSKVLNLNKDGDNTDNNLA